MDDEKVAAATVFTLDGVRKRLLFEGGSELEHWLLRQIDKASERDVMYLDACIGGHTRRCFAGKTFRPKAGGTAWSFSATMLDVAGGLRAFLDDWEEYPTI